MHGTTATVVAAIVALAIAAAMIAGPALSASSTARQSDVATLLPSVPNQSPAGLRAMPYPPSPLFLWLARGSAPQSDAGRLPPRLPGRDGRAPIAQFGDSA